MFIWVLHIERGVMDTVYKIILFALDPSWNKTNETIGFISFARQIERRTLWTLVDFLTASAMLYLFYCVGKKTR